MNGKLFDSSPCFKGERLVLKSRLAVILALLIMTAMVAGGCAAAAANLPAAAPLTDAALPPSVNTVIEPLDAYQAPVDETKSPLPTPTATPASDEQLRIVMKADFVVQYLLNKSEVRVFSELERAVGARNMTWRVMAQVSLGEVLVCRDPEAYRCINSKRVDLMLVDGQCRPRHAIGAREQRCCRQFVLCLRLQHRQSFALDQDRPALAGLVAPDDQFPTPSIEVSDHQLGQRTRSQWQQAQPPRECLHVGRQVLQQRAVVRVLRELRRELAAKAFSLTSYYDSRISNWLRDPAETPTHRSM